MDTRSFQNRSFQNFGKDGASGGYIHIFILRSYECKPSKTLKVVVKIYKTDRVNNLLPCKPLNATRYLKSNMSDTQIMLLENDRPLNQEFLDLPAQCPTTGRILEQKSSSKATLSLHSSPATSRLEVDPFSFDISDSPLNESNPQDHRILGTPLCSPDTPKPEIGSANDSEGGDKVWQGEQQGETDGVISAEQNAEADLAFLLDTQSPMLPLTSTSPVLGKQIRDELDAISLLQSRGVSKPVNTHVSSAPAPMASDNSQLELDINSPQTLKPTDDSSQLLQSAMYFMPKKHFNNHVQPLQMSNTTPLNTYIPTTLLQNQNGILGRSLPSTEPGPSLANVGTKRSFAAAAVAAVGVRRNFDGMSEGGDESFKLDESHGGGKRAKYAMAGRNNRKAGRGEGRGRDERTWIIEEAAEASATQRLSEEELRKLRRVKNRASVEKCRTKQRLRMEALQVEQKCLMSECSVIQEALGKVENVLREACQYGQLLGVSDKIRESVIRLLGHENETTDVGRPDPV